MDWLFDSQLWMSLLTLTVLEIILGIDNIVVISILSHKLPGAQQDKARKIGLSLALATRVLLLLSIVWLASLTAPLFTVMGMAVSMRDMIMLGGGLFLIVKGTREIHEAVEAIESQGEIKSRGTFGSIIVQIVALDIVFSLDSVITAVGMAQDVGVMITAVVIAIFIMLFASSTISAFIHKHPSLKLLALSFVMMVGVALLAEGMHFHIPKGYLYFAMGFSGVVEVLNLIAGNRKKAPVLEAEE